MKIRTTKKLIKKLINNNVFCVNYDKGLYITDKVVNKDDSIIFHKHYIELVRCNVPCYNIAYYRINFINKMLLNI